MEASECTRTEVVAVEAVLVQPVNERMGVKKRRRSRQWIVRFQRRPLPETPRVSRVSDITATTALPVRLRDDGVAMVQLGQVGRKTRSR
jgi:hypothetical protein